MSTALPLLAELAELSRRPGGWILPLIGVAVCVGLYWVAIDWIFTRAGLKAREWQMRQEWLRAHANAEQRNKDEQIHRSARALSSLTDAQARGRAKGFRAGYQAENGR